MERMNTSSVRVAELLGEELGYLHLRVLSGESHLDNGISHPRVQKPGLAFAGYYAYIKPGRVQIIGESETEYLKTLDDDELWDLAYWLETRGAPPETTDDERAGWHVVRMHPRRAR